MCEIECISKRWSSNNPCSSCRLWYCHSKVVDKNKLKREIEKYQKELKEEQILELQSEKPGGYWFDGKKDDTLFVETDSQGKKKNIVKKEEHVSVISQPGGQYVTHLTHPDGRGVEIADDLISFLKEFELLGCDGL